MLVKATEGEEEKKRKEEERGKDAYPEKTALISRTMVLLAASTP